MADESGVSSIEARLRARAQALGFADLGITTADDPGHIDYLRSWLADGNHGEMTWLADADGVRRRGSLVATLDGVRSVIVVAEAYPAGDNSANEEDDGAPSKGGQALIARYARGRDYHLTLVERLRELGGLLGAEVRGGNTPDSDRAREDQNADATAKADEPHRWTAYADTGPLLERDLARRAGLGWFGRNTLLIHPKRGSYFLLGVILTTRELTPDAPFEADHCGSCNACVDACPTGALLGRDQDGAPQIDARRCISYLTIELRGAIPEELREPMGTRVFGCDICQEVCPWTDKFGPGQEARPEYQARPDLDGVSLVDLTERILAMSGKEYLRVFAESPLSRPRRNGMLRNLCVALGNWGATSTEAAERARPVLERAAADHSDLVREHANWAKSRLG